MAMPNVTKLLDEISFMGFWVTIHTDWTRTPMNHSNYVVHVSSYVVTPSWEPMICHTATWHDYRRALVNLIKKIHCWAPLLP